VIPMKTRGSTSKAEGLFQRLADWTAQTMGHAWAFTIAFLIVLAWAVSGPVFHFSDTWQLIINTSTTVLTFLMVFLIQGSQNRDAAALHLKLDEVILMLEGPRDEVAGIEQLTEKEIKRRRDQERKDRGEAR
jgi:low affinity Fe/Cu permease